MRPSTETTERRTLRRVTAALVLLFGTAPAHAAVLPGSAPVEARQSEEISAVVADPGEDLEVRLVTVAPGDALVSRFGHTALWLVDHGSGTSRAYGFGLSDFRRPGFLYELLEGRVESWGGEIDPDEMLDLYRGQDRRISVQTLNLGPSQRVILREVLHREMRAENGFVNYDFFRANCTTAVRDVIDEALGGQLRAATAGDSTPHTFRSLSRPYTISALPLHTVMTLVVANSVDQPIDAWEAMFLPTTLRDALRDLRIDNGSGQRVPLVADEEVVYESGQETVDASAGSPWPHYLFLGVALGGLLAWLGWAAGRSGTPYMDRAFATLAGGWVLLGGMIGFALLGLWGFTGQSLTHWNANLLQANPLLVLVGIRAWGTHADRQAAARVAWGVVVLGSIGLALQVGPIPSMPETPVVALALPVHVGLAWGLSRTRSPASRAERSGMGGAC